MLGWVKKLFEGGGSKADPDEMAPGARKTFVELVIVQVKHVTETKETNLTGAIIELAAHYSGFPKCTLSDVVLVTFDSQRPGISSIGFKTELLSKFKQDMRALYGTTWTVTGNLGNEKRMEYGNLYPGLNEALERLDTLEFGDMQKHEFPNWFGDE